MLRGTWRLLLIVALIVGLLVFFGVKHEEIFGKNEPYEEMADPRYDPSY